MPNHQLRYDVNCSTLFTELPLLERMAAAKEAGFEAVEFWWPFGTAVPPEGEVDAFVRAVRDAGVLLVGLNFFAGDMAGGDRGLVSWPGRSAEFRDNVEVTVGIGAQLGCRAFNALYGNRLDDGRKSVKDDNDDNDDNDDYDDLAVENLAFAARAAGEVDGAVLVEPLSGADRYPLRTAADAVAILDRVQRDAGATNVGLLADLYHLAVNGEDLDEVVTTYVERVRHVQVADAPGRGEPGSGRLDLDRHLTALQAGGYAGWVGLEYTPTVPSVDSFAWLPRARRAAR